MSITAAKRKSLPKGEFAIPSQGKYPIDTAARTRNAAARLEQNKSRLSPAEYSSAKGRIAAAAKKFGITSEYNAGKKRMSGGYRGLNMKIGSDGSMHIRHMGDSDRCVAFLPLQPIDESTFSEAVAMSDSPRLVWNKLATPGVFLGHPSGEFKMDSQTFSQIVKNFNHDGIKVPFDYEHASEQPVAGNAPKGRGDVIPSGWIHKMDARADGLYGAVEWLPDARKKILAGEFKYISPAIRFGATDGVTGKDVGAKLSSAAIVLKPFLKNLPEIRAADAAASLQMSEQADGTKLVFLCSEIPANELATMAAGGYAVHQNEFLPKFRRTLGMDDMSSASDMLDKVDRLRELCQMADGDPNAVVEGVPIGNYIQPMRDYMRMPANTTLADLLDAVSDMIGSTIDCDDFEMDDDDSPGAEMSDTLPAASQQPTSPAPVIPSKEIELKMETITLSEHEAKVAAATAPLTLQKNTLEAKVADLTTQLSDETAKVTKLNDEIKVRDAAVAAGRVDEAFETYKETRKLSDKEKKAMTVVLASDPALFEELYPKLAPSRAVLLRTLSEDKSGGASSAVTSKEIPDLKVLLADVQAKFPKLAFEEQFSKAYAEHNKLMAG